MSYCRWSSDDYQCDVYCYGDVSGGYTTHVAGRRHMIDLSTLPPPIPFTVEHQDEWMARHKALMALLEGADTKPIGLPYDGQSFNDPTAGEAAERLKMLKEVGYNVPQYAIDALLEEDKDKP